MLCLVGRDTPLLGGWTPVSFIKFDFQKSNSPRLATVEAFVVIKILVLVDTLRMPVRASMSSAGYLLVAVGKP